MKRALSAILLLSCLVASANEWAWNGFEVLGNHSVSREAILKWIPIQPGQKFQQDVPAWQKWCAEIVKAFSFSSAECSATRYSDFKAYLIVDVVEKGQEYRSRFRAAPSKDLPLADKSVMATYEKLQARLWELFSQGKPPQEDWKNGYLDYSDPEMHRLVLELVKSTPPHRKNAIRVLARHRLPETRMAAADLLNWAGRGAESVLETHRLLDDPHSGVRNQLSRFMIHFVARISSPRRTKEVIDSLLRQLDRPSFGDRNKALFNLLEIASGKPALAPYIKAKGLALIRYVADRSILDNVSGAAKELLRLLHD